MKEWKSPRKERGGRYAATKEKQNEECQFKNVVLQDPNSHNGEVLAGSPFLSDFPDVSGFSDPDGELTESMPFQIAEIIPQKIFHLLQHLGIRIT